MFDLSQLDFSQDSGFVTVVAQDAKTGDVLMVARADRESIVQTLASGDLQCQTRRDGRWRPHTGNRQRVVSLECDCDGDALLARVTRAGPVCHTGASSCFTHTESGDGDPPDARHAAGVDAARSRLRELGEEAARAITSCSAGSLSAASESRTGRTVRGGRNAVRRAAAAGSAQRARIRQIMRRMARAHVTRLAIRLSR